MTGFTVFGCERKYDITNSSIHVQVQVIWVSTISPLVTSGLRQRP